MGVRFAHLQYVIWLFGLSGVKYTSLFLDTSSLIDAHCYTVHGIATTILQNDEEFINLYNFEWFRN